MVARKSKNGRAPAANTSKSAHVRRNAPSFAPNEDQIFAHIHDAMLDHRLQPGTKLKEVALADAFGVNRAVVRKVLARLSYNRLIARTPLVVLAHRAGGSDSACSDDEHVEIDREAARVYGRVRATLEKKGTPIGSLDMMIGAHALSLGVTLATNNTRQFSRIKGLTVVDWLASSD